jgi:indolepyruvate ferredoxin oxidoreductase beta subunit
MSKDKVYNVLIVGVGGQGIILVSDILAKVAANNGYDVKKNEIHGMAQRGGSVSSHVRFGPNVNSPIIKLGEADILISFEEMETIRYFPLLSKDGKVIINDLRILPPAVFTGQKDYPSGIMEQVKKTIPDTVVVKGSEKAKEIGNPRVVNILFLGALSNYLDIPESVYIDTLKANLKPNLIDINLKAFEEGKKLTANGASAS